VTPLRIVGLVLAACLTALLALFFVQNSGRTVDLSYDLYWAAWHMRAPQPVVLLLAGTFVGGMICGALLPWLWSLRSRGGRTVSGTGRGDDAWA
jgi:hypothetical protein